MDDKEKGKKKILEMKSKSTIYTLATCNSSLHRDLWAGSGVGRTLPHNMFAEMGRLPNLNN